MNFFARKINQLTVKLGLANSKCKFSKTVICTDFPIDNLSPDTIYVRGEKKHLYTVAFICPCNSGHIVYLNLHQDEHPFWKIVFHINGTVTLNPSIWYKSDCFEHFFIKHGNVVNV